MSSKKHIGKATKDKDLGKVAGGGSFSYNRNPETGEIEINGKFDDAEEYEQFLKLLNGGHRLSSGPIPPRGPMRHHHPHGGYPRKPVSPKASSAPVEDINKI